MKLKVSFWNQIKLLRDLIFISLVYFFIVFFFFNSLELKLKIYLLIPYFLLFFLPVIILHLNYLKENNGIVFEIKENVILFKENNVSLKYQIDDFDEIIIFTGGTRNTVSPSLAHSNYYYIKIKLRDGSFFVITSLCSSKIDKILKENFKDVKTMVEKVFYPIIKTVR